MALITAPVFSITTIDWYLDRPAQVNRSAYAGSRAVVSNPWHGKWRASVTFKKEQGETAFLKLRAFLISLDGQVNTFLLPATEAPQHGYGAGTIAASAAKGATSLVLTTLLGAGFEIIANPHFTTTTLTGWTAQNGSVSGAVVSGQLQVTSNAVGWFYYTAPVQIGLPYTLGATMVSATGTPRLKVGSALGLQDYAALNAPGSISTVIIPTTTSVFIAVEDISGTTGQVTTIDDVSLRPTYPMKAGMLATVTLPSGNYQMVGLTSDIATDGSITFKPPLREAVSSGAAIDHDTPDCHVALANSEVGWNVASWRRYGVSLDVEEAF